MYHQPLSLSPFFPNPSKAHTWMMNYSAPSDNSKKYRSGSEPTPAERYYYDHGCCMSNGPYCRPRSAPTIDRRREVRGESFGHAKLRSTPTTATPSANRFFSVSWWSSSGLWQRFPRKKKKQQQQHYKLAEHSPVWFTQFSANPPPPASSIR